MDFTQKLYEYFIHSLQLISFMSNTNWGSCHFACRNTSWILICLPVPMKKVHHSHMLTLQGTVQWERFCWRGINMDQITLRHQTLGRLFLKLTCTEIWRQLFICLKAPSPPRFLFGVVKQFCRFGIWSNAQCITPVDALHTTWSLPPPPRRYTVYKYILLYLFTQGSAGGGQPVRRFEGR